MKYKEGQYLYYVNPFIFTIEVVEISFPYVDELGEWYIDSTGAYLAEHDLFDNLDLAKHKALERLNKFYSEKLHEIQNKIPEQEKDDLWS